MKRLKVFLKKKTSKHVAVNTLGSYLNAFFTLTFTLILTRVLTRAQYGTQSVILALTYVTTNVLDFGISGATYSFLPGYRKKREDAISFLKSNLVMQIGIASMAVVLLTPFIPVLNTTVFKTNVSLSLYMWAILGVPLYVLQNFTLNTLYASQKFLEGNAYVNGSHLFKLIVLLWLIFTGRDGVASFVILFGVAGPLFFILLVLIRRHRFILEIATGPIARDKIKLRYTGQYFISEQLFAMATRLDLFVVSYFLPQSSVGLYALAQKIIANILTFVGSVTQVLSPEFSLVATRASAISMLKKATAYLSIPAILFATIIVTPNWLYDLIFTREFVLAAPIARLFAISYIGVAFMAGPVLFLLYAVKKPYYLIVANVLLLSVSMAGAFILIPSAGLVGAPLAILLGYIVNFTFILTVSAKELLQFKRPAR